ncbi:hypothetical protein HY251_15960 [bacterium]|nr:hypothetical protein [bacterium]
MRAPSDDFFAKVYEQKDPDLLKTLRDVQNKKRSGTLSEIALTLELLAKKQIERLADEEDASRPKPAKGIPDDLARFASHPKKEAVPGELAKFAAAPAPAPTSARRSLLDEPFAPATKPAAETQGESSDEAPALKPERVAKAAPADSSAPDESSDADRVDESDKRRLVAHHVAHAEPAPRSALPLVAAAGVAVAFVLAGLGVMASRKTPAPPEVARATEPAENTPQVPPPPRNESEQERRARLNEIAADAIRAAQAGAVNLAQERLGDLSAKATAADSDIIASAEAKVGQLLAEARHHSLGAGTGNGASTDSTPGTTKPAVLGAKPKPEAAPPTDLVLDARGFSQPLSQTLRAITGWDNELRKKAFAKLDETAGSEAERLLAALLGAPRATREKIGAVLARVAPEAPAAIAKVPADGAADEALKAELALYIHVHMEKVVHGAVLAAVRELEADAEKEIKKLNALLRPPAAPDPKKKPEKNTKTGPAPAPDDPWAKRREKNEKAFATLAAARTEALRVIFDLTIYPDEDHGRVGQPIVDSKVDAVKGLYPEIDFAVQDELVRFYGINEKEAQRRIGVLEDARIKHALACAWLEARGDKPAIDFPTRGDEALLRYRAGSFDDAIAMATSGLTPFEGECLKRMRDQRVSEWNESLSSASVKDGVQPTGVEIEQVRITNEYRVTMGRSALEIDSRLVSSARGHSEEMVQLGYFAHESPVQKNRSPVDRTTNAGYDWQGVGENIAMGMESPMAAHMGWYNSSGHHRNILNDCYMAMGTGKDSNHWTQNFGGRGRLRR